MKKNEKKFGNEWKNGLYLALFSFVIASVLPVLTGGLEELYPLLPLIGALVVVAFVGGWAYTWWHNYIANK